MGEVVSARLTARGSWAGRVRRWLVAVAMAWATVGGRADRGLCAEEYKFITFNSIRGRSTAMAGAYVSVEDGLSAMLWNPAAFGGGAEGGRRLRAYVHPLGPVIAGRQLRDVDLNWKPDDALTLREGLLALALLVRGATFCTPTWSAGLVGFEESLGQETRARFFDLRSAAAAYWNVLAVSVRLAPTVSLGGSAALACRWDERSSRVEGDAYSFGVLLKPTSKMNVGLAYFNLPREAPDSRTALERIQDETVNAGFSYYPDDRTLLSVDLRNLSDDEREAAREVHWGVERLVAKWCAVRMGYWRRRSSQPAEQILTAGMGIGPAEQVLRRGRSPNRMEVLTYAFVREARKAPGGSGQDTRIWHVVSLLLRI